MVIQNKSILLINKVNHYFNKLSHPKIIIVDNSIYITGAIKSIVALTNKLSNQYHFEFAMNAQGDAANFVMRSGYFVHDIRYLELSKNWISIFYPFALMLNSYRLAKLARVINAEIIHVNDIYNQSGLLAKLFNQKLKVVYHVRLTPNSYLKPIYPIFSWIIKRWSDYILYVSLAAGRNFISTDNASLIYDALSHNPHLPPKKTRRELINCRFLYVGNYIRGKGQNLALEAFSQLASSLQTATLMFVGSGSNGELDPEFVENLKNFVTLKNLHRRVQFNGSVDDIELIMKNADIVINFSESESFSMVCLEALTFGMPLIATDCGGPSEIIEHNVTGLLIENRNIDQAVTSMYRLATEPGLATRFSRQGPINSSKKFSVTDSAKKLAETYKYLLRK